MATPTVFVSNAHPDAAALDEVVGDRAHVVELADEAALPAGDGPVLVVAAPASAVAHELLAQRRPLAMSWIVADRLDDRQLDQARQWASGALRTVRRVAEPRSMIVLDDLSSASA